MPDYMFLLESRLSPEQRAVMLRVQELSAALGFNAYLTGGTVRDLVTGASLRDPTARRDAARAGTLRRPRVQCVPDGRHRPRPRYWCLAARSRFHRGGESLEDRSRTRKRWRPDHLRR